MAKITEQDVAEIKLRHPHIQVLLDVDFNRKERLALVSEPLETAQFDEASFESVKSIFWTNRWMTIFAPQGAGQDVADHLHWNASLMPMLLSHANDYFQDGIYTFVITAEIVPTDYKVEQLKHQMDVRLMLARNSITTE